MTQARDLPRAIVRGKSGKRGFELAPEVLNDTSGIVAFLRTRRSTVATDIAPPAPRRADIELMLEVACRVPDHGKLTPWRFIVLQGHAREELARVMEERWRERCREEEKQDQALEKEVALVRGSPVIVVVIASMRPHPRIPAWEQELSAGAACMNLLNTATALGLAAQWRTGWAAYDERVGRWLGLRQDERVAAFIHVGTRRSDAPALTDRRRPFWEDLTEFRGGDE